MIPWIIFGSDMRATPPAARMSAGTRSRAMTATAPASSAILACSGVTTSMITPPLSCSAMPRLTRAVPVSGDWGVLPGSVVDTVDLSGAAAARGRPGTGRAALRPHRRSGPPGRKRANRASVACRALQGEDRRGFVVHLEGHRERGVPGQPEPAHLAVFAQRPGGPYGVVVEPAGHRDPADRLGELVGGRFPAGGPADLVQGV